jgi:hypothetical protein
LPPLRIVVAKPGGGHMTLRLVIDGLAMSCPLSSGTDPYGLAVTRQ